MDDIRVQIPVGAITSTRCMFQVFGAALACCLRSADDAATEVYSRGCSSLQWSQLLAYVRFLWLCCRFPWKLDSAHGGMRERGDSIPPFGSVGKGYPAAQQWHHAPSKQPYWLWCSSGYLCGISSRRFQRLKVSTIQRLSRWRIVCYADPTASILPMDPWTASSWVNGL